MQTIIDNFPYRSQRDNERNPGGSCNVTSIAMCLLYWGIVGDGSYRQLEDQCYARCLDRGWSRHSPLGLKSLAESYPGIKNDFTDSGSLQDIRDAIDKGIPCVIHGWFTAFGHIIAVKGYDDSGLIVNDPWGEWFPRGYDIDARGEGLHYSYNLILRTCSEDVGNPDPSDMWVHRIYK